MAIANSYPMGTPKSSDLLLGTSVPRVGIDEKATTKNFSISEVITLATRKLRGSNKNINKCGMASISNHSNNCCTGPSGKNNYNTSLSNVSRLSNNA